MTSEETERLREHVERWKRVGPLLDAQREEDVRGVIISQCPSGIVLAYAAGVPLALDAFCSGLLCAVGTGFIKSNSRVKEDTVMGVVFAGMFAFGLVLFTKIESDQHLNHILFGSLLGIPVLNYVMLSLLALAIVASLQAVGILLVVAMLITPGCVGFLLTDRFHDMQWVAAGSAIFSSLTGVYASFFINGSTGSCIVLVQSAIFLLALLFSPKRGLLAGRRLSRQPSA